MILLNSYKTVLKYKITINFFFELLKIKCTVLNVADHQVDQRLAAGRQVRTAAPIDIQSIYNNTRHYELYVIVALRYICLIFDRHPPDRPTLFLFLLRLFIFPESRCRCFVLMFECSMDWCLLLLLYRIVILKIATRNQPLYQLEFFIGSSRDITYSELIF